MQYMFTHALIPTTNDERVVAVEEAENDAMNYIMPPHKQLKHLVKWLMLLKKKVEGGNLTTKQQKYLNKIDAFALPLWQNHTIAEAKKDAIMAEQSIDIDSDFNKTEIDE